MADSSKETQVVPDTESTAVQKVFGLPELLENILKQLLMKDLFVLQRTNSTFRDTIKVSKAVRLAMHLDIPKDGPKPGKSTELFGLEIESEYLLASSALRRVMYPFHFTYSPSEEHGVQFRCHSTYNFVFHTPKSHGSWREIKFAWGKSPVPVEGTFKRQRARTFAPTATIDDLLGWFCKVWDTAPIVHLVS